MVASIIAWIDGVVASGPTVLALEDLHWADPSSIELAGELAAADRPLLIVMTSRVAVPLSTRTIELDPLSDRNRLVTGDLLRIMTSGGGGWGNPLERDPELVRADVNRGLVSQDGAKRYGVVVDNDMTVNEKKTRSLRARMAQKRGEPPVFDFGGTVDELKKRCKKETGHEPPRPPEFQTWVTAGKKVKAAAKKKTKRKRKSRAA